MQRLPTWVPKYLTIQCPSLQLGFGRLRLLRSLDTSCGQGWQACMVNGCNGNAREEAWIP